MKMRISLVTAIYDKILEAKVVHSESHRMDVITLMSTDTDRIVNSAISFHSFWSVPFQVYTNFKLTFLFLTMYKYNCSCLLHYTCCTHKLALLL